MIWEQKCVSTENKYHTCTYANCPIYMGDDRYFDTFRLKCKCARPLHIQSQEGRSIDKPHINKLSVEFQEENQKEPTK